MNKRVIVCLLAGIRVFAAEEQLRPAVREPASVDSGVAGERDDVSARLTPKGIAGTKAEAAQAHLADSGVNVRSLLALGTRTVGRSAYVRMQQHLDGIPVRDAHVVVQINSA